MRTSPIRTTAPTRRSFFTDMQINQKEATMNTDKETGYAWRVILKKIKELREKGYTQESIGEIMGVSKTAVSRWLSDNKAGGERTTFGDMLRYAKNLNIDPQKLTEETFFTSPFPFPDLPHLNVDYNKLKQKHLKEGFKPISFDAPEWMIEELNKKSNQIGINRQSLIRVWIAEKLDHPESH